MKKFILVGILGAALAAVGSPATRVSAQSMDKAMALGTFHLNRAVMVDGKKLAAGTYQLRLTMDHPKAATGESSESEQFVEILKGNTVVARDVATVVSKADIASIGKGDPAPAPGSAKVEMLKGDDYIRVWVNKDGTHYLLHFPVSA